MGQLLLVQSAGERGAQDVFDRALRHFRALHFTEPHDVLSGARVAVATFPRLNGSGARIERGANGGFRAAVGTWMGGATDAGPPARDADGLVFVTESEGDAVVCATDRGGRLHAYAAQIDGCVVVATSALVLAALSKAPFDPLGCQEMLGAGSVFEGRSLFQGIRKLDAASEFRLERGRIASERRTWSLAAFFAARPEPTDVPTLARALTAATDRTLAPFAKPILDLTGGFDSRAIAAAALATGRPFQCVVNGHDADPDVVSAERIAKTFGLHLLRLRPGIDYGLRSRAAIERATALTDGEFDGVEYSDTMAIHERLARVGDVSVNGSAGEVCRGYWWDLLGSHVGSTTHFDHGRAARRFVPDDWADGMLAAPAAPRLAAHFEEVIRRANAGLEALPNTARADAIYLTLRMQRWAGRLASATDRIWPCATPFMSQAPLEAALAAPRTLRAHNRMARALIDHLNPPLAALPMAGGYPASPLRAGNALRFLPLVAELGGKAVRRVTGARRGPLVNGGRSVVAGLWADEEIRDLFAAGRMRSAGLYRPVALQAFLAASEAPGFADARKFGRVVTLEIVARLLSL